MVGSATSTVQDLLNAISPAVHAMCLIHVKITCVSWTVNAYGSFFDHVSGMEDYIHEFLGDRALVLYYEQLKVCPGT
jgi:hypothetical protein